MRTLVTGANGFTARHLLPLLSQETGAVLETTSRESGGPAHYRVDLEDPGAVQEMVERAQPDRIYHLAGRFTNDLTTDMAANVLATRNLLEALAKHGRPCRVLLIGSAAEYGDVAPQDNPVQESHPLDPVSVYGLTKVFQTHLMRFFLARHGLDLLMARTFNLTGRGMSERLFVGRLYRQIEDLRQGAIARIQVGPLDAERDYLPVEDAVRFYRKIMERGQTGEIYNVGSGEPIRVGDLLERILREEGLGSDVVERDPRALWRPECPGSTRTSRNSSDSKEGP